MGFKVQKCCGCVDLRVGCIVIGIVQVLLAILSIAGTLVTGAKGPLVTNSFYGLPYAIGGSVALIFAAVKQDASMQTKPIAILAYIGTRLRCIALLLNVVNAALTVGLIVPVVTCLISILLSLYFMIVAFSFYQELKGQNASTEVQDDKPIQEVV